MKPGSRAKLTIPAELAYGPVAMGSIPANSVLCFDVELLEVKEEVRRVVGENTSLHEELTS